MLFLYCFVFFWFVAGLTCFHIYLISKGRTTYENFKFKGPLEVDDSSGNDGVAPCLRNWEQFCCVPIPPSRLQLRSHVRSPQRPTPTTTPLIRTTNGSASPVAAVAAGRRASVSIIPPQLKKLSPEQTTGSIARATSTPSSAATMVLSQPVTNGSLRGRSRRLSSPTLASFVLQNSSRSERSNATARSEKSREDEGDEIQNLR